MARKIGLAVVALAVVGVIAVKVRSSRSPTPSPAVAAGAAQTPTAPDRGPSVVMIADPREADMQCPCGEIIRRVRAARASGVAVDEFPPDDDAARRYGVTTVPTVVFVDAGGKVLARHEGESSEVLGAITAGLAKLEGARR